MSVFINAQDKWGDTPLHLSLRYSRREAVEFLLRNGANPNLSNVKDGFTPLHVICNNFHSENLVETFFQIWDEKHLPVLVNAIDKIGRTPLHWAVANFLLHAVDLLLDHGANISRFDFPTETYYGAELKQDCHITVKMERASRALSILESLENRGYEMNRSDALTVMQFLAECRLLDKSEELEKCFFDNEEFAKVAKKEMVKPNLSLYDLIQLRPGEAAKLITFKKYCRIAFLVRTCDLPERYIEACALHLCEKMSRGFFRSWAIESFMKLTRYRLPLECCDLIIDESLTNKDLYSIFLAATSQSSS
uniref:Uncharacterized protein n=1 Tax=Trichogramma kaykai TaxID=54128 RepID=A0ABD2X2H5_9HYME